MLNNNETAELRAALKDAEAKSEALQQQQNEAVEQLVASKMEIASQALELEKLRGQLRALQVPLPGANDEVGGGGKDSPPKARRRRSQSHPAPVQPSTSVTTPSPSMAAAAVAVAMTTAAERHRNGACAAAAIAPVDDGRQAQTLQQHLSLLLMQLRK